MTDHLPAQSMTFTHARLDLMAAAAAADALGGLSDIERAQMRAIAGLARLDFHRVPMFPTGADARELANDLEALWGVVDPLIAVIGSEAISGLGLRAIHRHQFERVLEGALDGHATFALNDHAEEMDQDARELAVG